MKTIELLREMMKRYFTDRDPISVLPLLAEDVHCYGLASGVEVRDAHQAAKILQSEDYRQFTAYRLEVTGGEELGEASASLCFTLTARNVTIPYCVTGSAREVQGERRLYLLHFSLISPRQTLTLYEDEAKARKEETARSMLRAAIPGGVIGAYLEDGLPFYCINDTLLRYLGYASEEEFVQAVQGLTANAVYPKDRERVVREMREQIEGDGTYQIEYRLRKKDGSYIWLHDVGKKITAEDGRAAAVAACYDISTEKEHAQLLDSLVDNAAGGMAMYRVEEDWRMTPLFATPGVGKLAGLNEQEYMELCGEDAMGSIFAEDRGVVMESIREAILQDKVTSQTYRVPHRDGTYHWINGFFSRMGFKDGRPVMRAVYTPASVQYEVQLKALSQGETGVCVIDAETNELYYANDAAFVLHGTKPCDYTGKTCCEAFYSEKQQCAHCWRNRMNGELHGRTVAQCRGKTLSISAEMQEWNRRKVVVVYQQDVTEQQALQTQAEKSNRELQQLLHNMACGVCVCTLDAEKKFAVRYISNGFCKLFEGTEEELRQAYVTNPAHGVAAEDMPRLTEFLAQMRSGPFTGEITYRYTTIKGTHLWLTLKAVFVSDDKGGLIGYTTYFDVTEQMKTQKMLADVVHNAPGGVCMYRWDGKGLEPLIVSEQVVGLLGTDSAETARKLHHMDFGTVHPEDMEELRESVLRNLEHPGKTYSHTYRVWNEERGDYRWICTSGVCVAQEDGTRIIYANYSDVDEAKRLEGKLRQEEELLEAACDVAELWSWTYDVSADRIHCFRKMRQEFGVPETMEHYPESWLSLGLVETEWVTLYRDRVLAVKRGSEGEQFDLRMRCRDGVSHWCRIHLNRLVDSPDMVIGTAQIIDNEKYLEARMEVEEKQQSEGGASLLAHFITNLSQKKVMAHSYHFDEREELLAWNSIEDQLERTEKYIVFPEKRKLFREMHDVDGLLSKFAKGHTGASLEYRRLFPDGRIMWVRSVIHLIQEPKSGDILNFEYLYDIHQSHTNVELMSAVISFGYELCASLMVDSDQVTVLRSQRMHGRSDLEVEPYTVANTAYADTILPEDRDMYLQACSLENISRQLKTCDHFEIIHRTLENGEIHYKKDQCYDYAEDKSTCLLIRSDVTDVVRQGLERQAKLQEALEQRQEALAAKEDMMRDREQIYTALFSMVPLVISSNLTKNTYGMLNYTDYTTKKAAACGVYDNLIAVGVGTVPEDQRKLFAETFGRRQAEAAFQRGEKMITLVHQQLGDDGVMRWIETRSVFVKDGKDGDLYTITLAQDVTERKEQEVALKQALQAAKAATQAKSEFLSRMSHEIRTPMNAIMGMTAIAKDSHTDLNQVFECLEKIDMSSHFLLTLINDILEMSRIESGRTEIKHEPFKFELLVESIRTVVEPLAQRSGLRYDFVNNADTEREYIGDAMRIQQVLINLITNAIKFTKEGGRVRFSVNIASETKERALFKFVVEDTGIGMSPEFMKKMFTPFTQEDGSNTSRFGGSGLGLAISKSLTEAMHGTIGVESYPGVGSTFTVTLPLDRADPSEAAEESEGDAPKAADMTVLRGAHLLMAEDHPLNVLVARKLLERKGIRVTVAENGRRAVELFSASEQGSYDAILMDIRMPVMDGLDAARAIRALPRADAKGIPMIAMTANALDEDRKRSRDAGMDAHLAKPFEPEQLYRVLAEQIARGRK